jgi:hypothetical protein
MAGLLIGFNCKLQCNFSPRTPKTSPKTEGYERPESKTNQQLAEPDEICTTSIGGSRPPGACQFPNKIGIALQRERAASRFCSQTARGPDGILRPTTNPDAVQVSTPHPFLRPAARRRCGALLAIDAMLRVALYTLLTGVRSTRTP